MQVFRLTQKMMTPMRPSMNLMQRSTFQPSFFMATPQRMFATKPADYDVSDDTSMTPRISLDDFYGNVIQEPMTDEQALEYMNFAAKMAMVSFKDEEEMLSFKGDFQAALSFITKLDEVDTKGTEPMGNVLEYYGGNDTKVRGSGEVKPGDDQLAGLDFRAELKKLNKHMVDGYVVFNKPKALNPDCE